MSLHLHTFTSVFSTNLLIVGLPRKAFPAKQAKVDTGHVFFYGCASNAPRIAQGQPNGYFQMKEHDGTIEPIARMNAEWRVEKAEFAEFNLPNVATLQFDSCGLNLTCLDQCHGVRSHGTSSSQGWRTIIVIQHFKGWSMSLHPCFQPTCFMQECQRKPSRGNRHMQTSVFFCGCGDSPRFAQWLFSKERTWWNNWTHCSNECWMKGGEGWVCWVRLANMWQHCSLTAVQRKTPFVEESWWPEFHMFGSHGVRSLCTSSSQGWRKIIVIQSTV